MIALGIAAFAGMLIVAAGRPTRPVRGDHWHARYSVVICGQTQPQFPPTRGDIHTHGDGVIHIHPEGSGDSGANANLGRFFNGAGDVFARDRIMLPDGSVHRNGDRCADGHAGTVHLMVNGRPSEAFDRYVPQDGDAIVVEFQ